MLFIKKKKPTAPKPSATKPEWTVLWNKTFKQSDSRKGFYQIRLTTYGEKGVEAALAHFEESGFDFKGKTIRLECVSVAGVYTDGSFMVVNVYAAGKRVGCVYDSSPNFARLCSAFAQVHLEVNNGDVYLYVG